MDCVILSEREVHGHWLLNGSQSDPGVRSAKNGAFLFNFSTFLMLMEKICFFFHVENGSEVEKKLGS